MSHNKNHKGSDQSVNTSPIVRNKHALVSLLLTLIMDLALGTEKVVKSLQLDYWYEALSNYATSSCWLWKW